MLKSKLPTTQALLKPEVHKDAFPQLNKRQKIQKYFDHSAKEPPKLHVKDSARLRLGKVWEPAVVSRQHEAPRSFIVTTPDNAQYRRNRKHLLKTAEESHAV
ncbi:hypothetical protein EOD39_4219 [Acipenser ruthenus]|uniref:Uncharacterized protein n=1 Tax=Acipenser ruthenus TaxID=7906 RepID=A0A444UJB5_ACIRT|nr:hypothetical protein EOD39_4219 [Acipenser ruthenus]